jgi:DNA ligase-1
MKRFGRKLEVDRMQAELPLTPFFFDVLYVDGNALVDEPLSRRVQVLDDVARRHMVPRLVTADATTAAEFAGRALAAGHEGVMAKASTACQRAGAARPG